MKYSEYKLADKVRAEAKRAACIDDEKITLYAVCGSCGKRRMEVLYGEATHKPLVPCEFVCGCTVA